MKTKKKVPAVKKPRKSYIWVVYGSNGIVNTNVFEPKNMDADMTAVKVEVPASVKPKEVPCAKPRASVAWGVFYRKDGRSNGEFYGRRVNVNNDFFTCLVDIIPRIKIRKDKK